MPVYFAAALLIYLTVGNALAQAVGTVTLRNDATGSGQIQVSAAQNQSGAWRDTGATKLYSLNP